MHVISYRKLKEFVIKHGDAQEALDSWFKIASKAVWLNLVDVKNGKIANSFSRRKNFLNIN